MPDYSQLQLDFGTEYPPKEKLLEYIIGAFKKYEIPYSLSKYTKYTPHINVTLLRDHNDCYMQGRTSIDLTADFGGIDNVIQRD